MVAEISPSHDGDGKGPDCPQVISIEEKDSFVPIESPHSQFRQSDRVKSGDVSLMVI